MPILRLSVFVVLFLFTFGSGVFGQQPEIIDQVVAKVGGEIILLSDIESQFALMKSEQGSLPEEARCLILDNLMTQKLLLNQARIDSIEVGDEEVEGQLNARIDRILRLMNNDVSQFEAYYGRTITEVKSQLREDLKDQMLTERMQGSIMQQATITPREVRQFFAQIPEDSLPYFDSEVEIREIVMFPEVNATERQKAYDKLAELRQSITEGGESFAELATKYSDDPGSARNGGDLGWASRGDYVQEFEATAYNLEIGEVSEIIETEYGFHFMELLERRGNTIRLRHILLKPDITQADLDLTILKLDSVRRLIADDSLSFSDAVKEYSSEDRQSYNNDGRVVNPKSGDTFFEIADLEPEVYFAIEDLEVGEMTEPIAIRTQMGERAFQLVKVESLTNPHKASLDADYSKIRNAALEEKRARITSDWVENKIKSTFVEVTPSYRQCPMMEVWMEATR
jgi:peptidyl-prolyl cis-trans isomerase SurA